VAFGTLGVLASHCHADGGSKDPCACSTAKWNLAHAASITAGGSGALFVPAFRQRSPEERAANKRPKLVKLRIVGHRPGRLFIDWLTREFALAREPTVLTVERYSVEGVRLGFRVIRLAPISASVQVFGRRQ
jgi:hypothetical protein